MSYQSSNPDGAGPSPTVAAAIKTVLREHPFRSYERVAEELRLAGHTVSAFGVAWVAGTQ